MKVRSAVAFILCIAIVAVCMPWPEEEREHDPTRDALLRAVAPTDSNVRAIGADFTQIERNAREFRDSMPSRRYILARRSYR